MRFRWRQELGDPQCPYIRRWVADFGFFSIRLHHWLSSDDQRHFHDHAWWYATFILKGSYTDRSPKGDRIMRPGMMAFYPATHQHTVKVNSGGCWSLLVTGRESREWGFWVKNRFLRRNKYFFRFGHHQCDP